MLLQKGTKKNGIFHIVSALQMENIYNYKLLLTVVANTLIINLHLSLLMAVVDADYNFLFADVGCQGRISDGGVIKNTEFYH